MHSVVGFFVNIQSFDFVMPSLIQCFDSLSLEQVFINRQPAIIVNRKAQSFVVNAGAPVIIKPAPVVIQRPGSSEYRPYVQTVTSAPIVVTKKIIKIDRPIVKKFYQEAYSQTEACDCGSQTIPLPTPPVSPPCGLPARKYCDFMH